MGLLSRRPTNAGDQTLPRYQRDVEKRKKDRERFSVDTGNFNVRPSFIQWVKMIWADLLALAIMGAVGLGVYSADPVPRRLFPVFDPNGEIVFPEFAYPLRKNLVPIWLAALLASAIPILTFLVCQIRIRSFWDLNNSVLGLLYSLVTAAVFQVFIKWLIGGLRPHFLAVCDPDVPSSDDQEGSGFRSMMYDRRVCTGDKKEINDSLESFPSGHATAAFAGFIFLYLYLNAKLKIFANYHPAYWKMVVAYTPVLGAVLIAGSLTIDEFHNWYDVVAGGIIGTVMALSAYRMVYASVWDFRFNHIPLTRHTPFSYGAGAPGAGGFETALCTRQAGWGHEEALGGAPFDAGYHLRGHFDGGFSGAADSRYRNSVVSPAGQPGRHHGRRASGNGGAAAAAAPPMHTQHVGRKPVVMSGANRNLA